MNSSDKSKSAFTLVEMLVVVAILCLLIALLSPAVTSALERAKSTACKSNLREIHSATMQFATANQGWLPRQHPGEWGFYMNLRYWGHFLSYVGTETSDGSGTTLAPYMGKQRNYDADMERTIYGSGPDGTGSTGWYFPWTYPRQILTCPGVKGWTKWYIPTYGMNATISSWARVGDYRWRQKVIGLSNAANIVLAGDKISAADSVDAAWAIQAYGTGLHGVNILGSYYNQRPKRHANTCNLVMLDGHVVSLKYTQDGGFVNVPAGWNMYSVNHYWDSNYGDQFPWYPGR